MLTRKCHCKNLSREINFKNTKNTLKNNKEMKCLFEKKLRNY